MKTITIFIVVIVLAIFFYPKNYQYGIVDPNMQVTFPTCVGYKTVEVMIGVTTVTCYGVILK